MHFTNNITALLIAAFFLGYAGLSYFLSEKSRVKPVYIALFSVFLYATWYPPAIVLLLYNAVLAKWGGRLLESSRSRLLLALILVAELAPLLYFKYANFFLESVGLSASSLAIILPLGISFYTFSMLGYFVDVFTRRIKHHDNFIDLLLFVAFWPHLAAGPILRARNVFNNLANPRKLDVGALSLALLMISAGLVKKILIADNIGAYVDWNFSYGVSNMTPLESWMTLLGFGVQIYADFSGYSDMAIGFALLMGFELQANFNYPYRATSMTEFWRRWHISLSTWFRDYLYIPLGGSRGTMTLGLINLMVVFIVSGLWHGAAWGFVIWGAIHGVVLVLEKVAGERYLKAPQFLRWIITLLLVTVSWAFFRLEWGDAMQMVNNLFDLSQITEVDATSPYYVLVIGLMLFFPLLEHVVRFYFVGKDGFPVVNRSIASVLILAAMLLLSLCFSGEPLPFIYFEF